MAVAAGPDRVGIADLSPSTVSSFRGSDRESRLTASQDIFRKGILVRTDGVFVRVNQVLGQLGITGDELPRISKTLQLVNGGHTTNDDTHGWTYRSGLDMRRQQGSVDLNSPKPAVAEVIVYAGKEDIESGALDRLRKFSGSDEVARFYILDKTSWNPSEMVKALTGQKPLLGTRSLDQKLGLALWVPRWIGLVGVHSSKMAGRYDMDVSANVPGSEKVDRHLRMVVDIEGVGIVVGVPVDQSKDK